MRGWVAVAILGAGGVGCGGQLAQVQSLQADKARLENENADLKRKVGELESRESVLKAQVAKAEQGGSVKAEPKVVEASGEPKLKVVKLDPANAAGSPPTTAPTVVVATPPEDDDAPRPLLKIGPGGIEQNDPDEGPGAKKKAAKSPGAAAANEYDAAYALVKAKKWKPALDALAGFIVKYPDHPYVPNALYWRGRCYAMQGDTAGALGQFEAVVARFPAHAKAADSLLEAGLAHKKLGASGKAKSTFDRLRKEHPGSDASKKIPPEDS